jgi:hypothetical protein
MSRQVQLPSCRAAMEREQGVLLRVTITKFGPNVSA